MRVGYVSCLSELSQNVVIGSQRRNWNAPFRNDITASIYIPDFEIQNIYPEHIRLL